MSKQNDNLPRTYNANEVAEILRMKPREVYRAAKAGLIPGRITIGGRTRFSSAAIDRLASGEEAA